MDENIISWNFTNWITIVLMAALGFAVVASIGFAIKKFAPGAAASNAG